MTTLAIWTFIVVPLLQAGVPGDTQILRPHWCETQEHGETCVPSHWHSYRDCMVQRGILKGAGVFPKRAYVMECFELRHAVMKKGTAL